MADKAGDALLLELFPLPRFPFALIYCYFIPTHISPPSRPANVQRAPLPTHPGQHGSMALVAYLMTWFIASAQADSLRLSIQNAGTPDGSVCFIPFYRNTPAPWILSLSPSGPPQLNPELATCSFTISTLRQPHRRSTTGAIASIPSR